MIYLNMRFGTKRQTSFGESMGYVLNTIKHLLNAYCCHLSQAWSFNDKNIKYIITAWNRAVRKIWNLPYDSHRI